MNASEGQGFAVTGTTNNSDRNSVEPVKGAQFELDMQEQSKLKLNAGQKLLDARMQCNAGLSTSVSEGNGLDINTVRGFSSKQNHQMGTHLTDPYDNKASVVSFNKKSSRSALD
jgi:hypothetical protein